MEQREYRLAAIMYTDIQGFSRMMERDEKGTIKLLEIHNEIIRAKVDKYKGNVIKTIGDAFLTDFRNTVDAVACALEIQQEIMERNDAKVFEPLLLRIGVHLGDIYFYENDALGEGINIASRLQSKCKAGAVCISQDVYNQVVNKIPIEAVSLGRMDLKNITKEVNAYHLQTACYRKYGDAAILTPSTSLSEKNEPDNEYSRRIQRAREISQRIRNRFQSDSRFEDRNDANRHHKDENYPMEDEIARFAGRIPQAIIGAVKMGLDKFEQKDQIDINAVSMEYSEYKKNLNSKLAGEKAGLIPHSISYFIVNAILFQFGQRIGGFEWYYIVAAGWGIGLAGHVATLIADTQNKKDLVKLDETSIGQLADIKKLHHARRDFFGSIISMFTVPALLLLINLMVSPNFLWCLFPTIPIVISSLAKIPSFFAKKAQLLSRIFSGEKRTITKPVSNNPIVRQAFELKASIEESLKGFKTSDKTFGSDVHEVVEKYVTQIEDLDRRNTEANEIIAQIPMDTLDADLRQMTEKLNSTDNSSLQREYSYAIDEIKKQKKSYNELLDQKEILDLRVKNAVNQLKKFSIDVVRLKNAQSGTQEASSERFDKQIEELHQYLDDFSQGYNDMESLEKRFEELEKNAKPLLDKPKVE